MMVPCIVTHTKGFQFSVSLPPPLCEIECIQDLNKSFLIEMMDFYDVMMFLLLEISAARVVA